MLETEVVDDVNELPEEAKLSTASECHVPPLTPDNNKVMTGSLIQEHLFGFVLLSSVAFPFGNLMPLAE